MKVTSIKQQLKMRDRYSVYVDEVYTFSLSESALMDSGLHSGKELTKEQVADYRQLSQDDKLYQRAIRYVAMRQRTTWELKVYLERKGAAAPLLETILNKLSIVGLLDDKRYAQAFINDKQLLRPTSRRKIIMDLRRKGLTSGLIEEVFAEQEDSQGEADHAALRAVIERKRRQTKYQDDTKLMQYLARQGFGYGDIKAALHKDDD